MSRSERMAELVTWYLGHPKTYSHYPKDEKVWEDLWKKRKPRLIPINTDGPSRLAQFAIENHLSAHSDFKPASMVELGSGPGSRSIRLAEKYNLKLHLLDTSFNALGLHAKIHAEEVGRRERICPTQGSMLTAPFSDNSFDISFAFGPQDHFFGNERQNIFNEMFRITSPGGIAINIVPSQLNPFYTAEMVLKVCQDQWEFGPTKHFTPDELASRMKNAGFNDVRLYGASFFLSLLRLLPKSEQIKRYDRPTSSDALNNWIFKRDMDFNTSINRYFGGDMMAIGIKP